MFMYNTKKKVSEFFVLPLLLSPRNTFLHVLRFVGTKQNSKKNIILARRSPQSFAAAEGDLEAVVVEPAGGDGVGGRDRIPQSFRNSSGNAETVPASHQYSQRNGNGRMVCYVARFQFTTF
jgi:hypothetical protein